MEDKKEKLQNISFELCEIKLYNPHRWRKVLRDRFEQGNGLPWVQYLRNHFDTEKVFRDIKKDSTYSEIKTILEKRKV